MCGRCEVSRAVVLLLRLAASVIWECSNCGATGEEGYTRIFSGHYQVCFATDISLNDIPMDRPLRNGEEIEEVLSVCYAGVDFVQESKFCRRASLVITIPPGHSYVCLLVDL